MCKVFIFIRIFDSGQCLRLFLLKVMTVHLKIDHDGIFIYEDVTEKERLIEFINKIIHEYYDDTDDVDVELHVQYKNNFIIIDMNRHEIP